MNPASQYSAALYMRLSKDDEGALESASISSQRDILRHYAAKHEFPIYQEYIDDGYSGTNFDRPAFRRMLADIEAGIVNLVLTKDFSRLGRDYIMAGQYTEYFFPEHQVRYIAVGDGYDSAVSGNDIAPFRHVINEMYARDTSAKIRSALRAKMEEGQFIGHFAPYGYRKDPSDKNHLIPDEQTACAVVAMFHMAADGKRPSEIAAFLNGQHILTPSQYRNPSAHPLDRSPIWHSSSVCKILKNIVYLGHMAQGKSSKVSFKSHRVLANPQDSWAIVPNTHTPLIDEKLFQAVQSRFISRRSTRKNGFQNLFAGIAFCADCGRPMSITAGSHGGYNLACSNYKLHGKSACTNHFISYDELFLVVQRELRAILSTFSIQGFLSQMVDVAAPENHFSERLQALDTIISQLYEDRQRGILSEERFLKLYHGYEAEYQDLQAKSRLSVSGSSCLPDNIISELEQFLQAEALSSAVLRLFINKIEISQGRICAGVKRQNIKICFCFAPPGQNSK